MSKNCRADHDWLRLFLLSVSANRNWWQEPSRQFWLLASPRCLSPVQFPTATGYTRFLMMIANGGELDGVRLLKPETVKLMTTNRVPREAGWVKFGDEVRTGVGFGFGFNVRDEMSDWDPQGRVGEYGWGGAASTHYWVSPKDDLIVVTLEQVMPYSFMTETKIKGLVFDAIEK